MSAWASAMISATPGAAVAIAAIAAAAWLLGKVLDIATIRTVRSAKSPLAVWASKGERYVWVSPDRPEPDSATAGRLPAEAVTCGCDYSRAVYTWCSVCRMSIGHTLLGLLESGPRHGYDLKRAYDERFGQDRPLHYGQVYATLSRLLRNGLVEENGVEPGGGPDRKRYAITDAGVTDVAEWLSTPEKPDLYLQSTLYTKVVLALLTGRSASEVLDAQRTQHLQAMRTFTARKRGGDLADQLVCDHALFHLEADLRWLELTAARLDELRKQVSR